MRRTTNFSRGSHVPSASLNAMQDEQVGLAPATDAPATLFKGADGRWWTTPDAGLADGTLRVLDTSVDWRNRKVRGTFRNLGAADRRPGQANDHLPNDPTSGVSTRRFDDWTGAGAVGAAAATVADGTPPVFADNSFPVLLDEGATTSDRVFLYARPNDGALCLYNDSGATLHATLEVYGSAAAPTAGAAPSVPGNPAGSVTTSDGTWTTAITLTLAQSTAVTLELLASAIRDTGAEAGGWHGVALLRRPSSGAPVQVGSTTFAVAIADDAAWDLRVQISGSDVLVQVKGATAKTVRWRVEAVCVEARFG